MAQVSAAYAASTCLRSSRSLHRSLRSTSQSFEQVTWRPVKHRLIESCLVYCTCKQKHRFCWLPSVSHHLGTADLKNIWREIEMMNCHLYLDSKVWKWNQKCLRSGANFTRSLGCPCRPRAWRLLPSKALPVIRLPRRKKAATWPRVGCLRAGATWILNLTNFPVTDPWNGSMKIPIPIRIDIYSHNIHSHNWGLDFDLLNPFQSLHDLRLPDAFACTWLWTLILGDRRGFRFFQDGSDPLGDGVFVFRITTIFKSCPYTDENTLLGICLESVLN